MSQYRQDQEIDIKKLLPIAGGLAIIIGIILFGSKMTYTVEPGEKAVIFYRLGNGIDKENVKGQGFHFIAPWNDPIIYRIIPN